MSIQINSHMVINDFLVNPECFTPNDLYNFNVGYTFTLGFNNQESGEIFDINISNKCHKKEIIFSFKNIYFKKGCIEIDKYDYALIMEAINKYLDNIKTNKQNEILQELLKVFIWEYENYQ